MPKQSTRHSEPILPDSPQAVGRLVGNFLTTRVLIVVATLGAAVLLGMTAGFLQPVVAANTIGERTSLTILLTILTLLSCWFPASGPRYGEAVTLTPLVALIALLLLPPGTASIPLIFVAACVLFNQHDPMRRKAGIDRFLLMLIAQIVASIVLYFLHFHDPLAEAHLGAADFLREGAVAAIVYGALYMSGACLLAHRRASASSVLQPTSERRAWSVYWVNELVVFTIGGPVAALLSLLFARMGALTAASILLIVTAPLILVSRALIDGKMVRRQLRAMERLTQQAAIGKSLSIERLLTDFLDHSRKLVLYDRASVWLYNEEELVLEKRLEYIGTSVSFQPVVRRVGEELVGRVAERQKAILVDDVRRDARHRYFQLSHEEKLAIGPVSVMLIPFLASGDLIGVVEFERRELSAYDRQDRERIQSLAGLVAMTLANNRLHQEVVQQAVTDGLTGLYNKRQILKTLQDETIRAQRYGHTLSVMMLDLDDFKKFNDSYGHMQGDVLLQNISYLIKESIRSSDVAGRYGGEEFVVVMPETGREAAWVTAERIRTRIEAERFLATVNYEASIGLVEATEDHQPHAVVFQKTISIGVATFPADGADDKTLLARADEALYTAKNNGRNQVVLASYPSETQPRMMINIPSAESQPRRSAA